MDPWALASTRGWRCAHGGAPTRGRSLHGTPTRDAAPTHGRSLHGAQTRGGVPPVVALAPSVQAPARGDVGVVFRRHDGAG